MSEDHIIRHCAPTLAGLKTASMFTYLYQDKLSLLRTVRQLNRRLCAKGLRLLPLRFSESRVLLYLYRPSKLQHDLADSAATELLLRFGYCTGNYAHCVVQLVQKLREQADFPHEIGLFLGYPPEDVRGFIDHNACNCKCVGYWKVYGDESAAKKKFAQYKKCTRVYMDRWKNGTNIERLTVAG